MSIKVNLKIFLFAIIFYLTKQIHIYAMFMFFAFCHEIGHLICGVIMGLKPKSLRIMPMGLSIEFKVSPEDYNRRINRANNLQLKKMFIALAGPITNYLIIIFTIIVKQKIEFNIYQEIVYSNLLIATFNLIPIYPLDGGRVAKAIIHMYKGGQKSWDFTNKISNASIIVVTMISSVAIYYYKNIAILFVLAYLWGLVITENKKYQTKQRIYKIIEKELK